MRGFVFTIDSMAALLLAFMVISLPAGHLLEVGYTSGLVEESIAVISLRTGESPLALAERLGMCGEYALYNGEMGIIEKGETCGCDSMPYTYIYTDSGNAGLAVMRICRGNMQLLHTETGRGEWDDLLHGGSTQ